MLQTTPQNTPHKIFSNLPTPFEIAQMGLSGRGAGNIETIESLYILNRSV